MYIKHAVAKCIQIQTTGPPTCALTVIHVCIGNHMDSSAISIDIVA